MRKRFLLGLSLAVSFSQWAMPSSASVSFDCSEPSAPYCATSYGAFEDQYEFDRCKREMEDYESEVNEYIQCIQDELDRATSDGKSSAEDATSQYNDAVSSFNRRARG